MEVSNKILFLYNQTQAKQCFFKLINLEKLDTCYYLENKIMKKLFFLFNTFVFFLISILSFSQAPPEGINYQAVARDNTGKVISNNINLKIKFTIWDSISGGNPLFSETHNSVNTNIYGLFTLKIGNVNTTAFPTIPWAIGNKFLEIEIDTLGGSLYSSMGRTQMMSVPYALFAKTAGGGLTGTTGATGTTGSSGDTGYTGVTGSTGSIGFTGDNGSIGTTGFTGDIGSIGTTGSTGDIGSTGASGGTGLIGSTGNTGATGDIGITGSTGSDLGTHWTITGNTSTLPTSNFIGTSDAVDFITRTSNIERVRITSIGNIGIGTSTPSSKAVVEIASSIAGVLFPRMTTIQRLAIVSPPEGLVVYDLTAHREMVYDGTLWMEVGSVPIGSIQAWHKTFANTPSLPWGWVQCDGQTLSDIESQFNGQTIPNLNNDTQNGTTSSGMFLRGSSTSGTTQADATAVNGLSATTNADVWNYSPNFIASTIGSGGNENPYNLNPTPIVTVSSTDTETHPPNMTVVWIIKIK